MKPVTLEISTTLVKPEQPPPGVGASFCSVTIANRPATVKLLLSGKALHINLGLRGGDPVETWVIDLERLLVSAAFALDGHLNDSGTLKRLYKLWEDHVAPVDKTWLPSLRFEQDLEADSLDAITLIMAAEEEFGVEIADDVAEKWVTVGDAVEDIDRLLAAKAGGV